MLADQAFAALVRFTGISLDYLFLGGYLLALAATWAGIALIGERLYRFRWTTAALGLAFTLRHRIPRTSANSFEPYFHPRMLAFGICLLAVAAFLRRRVWLTVALVGAGALAHVTTGLWFAVLLGTAIVIVDRRLRTAAGWSAAAVFGAGAIALAGGALRDRLVQMDAPWLQAVASKDSLFPATQWPWWTWVLNLGLLAVLLAAERGRARRGAATPESAALTRGACALAGLFLVTLPLVEWHVALAVQLQISRVFWVIDFLATAWLIGELADRSAGRARAVMVVIGLLAAVRAGYGLERRDRPLVAVHLAPTEWHDAMAWLRQQPLDIHVLADPGHAWKYGSSVRVSAGRDVLLEEQKDSAIAMYSRAVAVRVIDRSSAIGDFSALTAERARALAARYDIDYVVTEIPIAALPEAYRNAQFRIYHAR